MKKWISLSIVSGVALATVLSANAQTTLTEILFNEDGTPTDLYPTSTAPIVAPGLSVTSGFGASSQPGFAPFYLNGLGTLQYTVTGTGAHSFISFVDDEADYVNGPFNDIGLMGGGAKPSYLSWQIDVPSTLGTTAFNNGPLLDANSVPTGQNDVSMALGFAFDLSAGEKATIDLSLTSSAPGGFYLADQNNFSGQTVYYSGSLSITGGTQGVPDSGATWIFLLLGFTGLAVMMGCERKFSLNRVA
jgi:hypothetical protein